MKSTLSFPGALDPTDKQPSLLESFFILDPLSSLGLSVMSSFTEKSTRTSFISLPYPYITDIPSNSIRFPDLKEIIYSYGN